MENKMFCYQCQETAGCSGCTVSGVCGKKPHVAALQDLLIYAVKGLSAVTTRLRNEGKEVGPEVNRLIATDLFLTITNVNFDDEAVLASIRCGSQNYSIGQILSSLQAGDQGDTIWRVVMHVRLPRTLGCLLAGCALAVAGVLIQSVLNNAMASPSIIGVNAGAGF